MFAFHTILIAADFSEASRDAFQAACSLAREGESRLCVLNVMEPRYEPEPTTFLGDQTARFLRVPRDPSEHESLKEQLREVYAPDHPLEVQFLTREGDAAEEILRASESLGSDLIVMGTHGRKGLRRLLAGSVAEAVLRRAQIPVLALRSPHGPHREEAIRVILHPTDFSQASEAPLQVARLLARDHGARLVLLYVMPVQVVVDGMMVAGIDPQAELDSLEVIRSRVDGPDLKQPVEIRLENGSAAFQILRVAEEIGADLIVMGTHGRSGIGRLILGSEAETVLRRADCPVLAVKGAAPIDSSMKSPVAVPGAEKVDAMSGSTLEA